MSLTENGGGTLTLTGSNSYTGGTTITSGTIQINSNSSLGVQAELGLDRGRHLGSHREYYGSHPSLLAHLG